MSELGQAQGLFEGKYKGGIIKNANVRKCRPLVPGTGELQTEPGLSAERGGSSGNTEASAAAFA